MSLPDTTPQPAAWPDGPNHVVRIERLLKENAEIRAQVKRLQEWHSPEAIRRRQGHVKGCVSTLPMHHACWEEEGKVVFHLHREECVECGPTLQAALQRATTAEAAQDRMRAVVEAARVVDRDWDEQPMYDHGYPSGCLGQLRAALAALDAPGSAADAGETSQG